MRQSEMRLGRNAADGFRPPELCADRSRGASTRRYISFGSFLITSRHGGFPDQPLGGGAEEIFARCEVLEERSDEEGAFFRVRSEQEALGSLCEKFSQAGWQSRQSAVARRVRS